jgi:pyridoxamine 5'-phosphate oxidase
VTELVELAELADAAVLAQQFKPALMAMTLKTIRTGRADRSVRHPRLLVPADARRSRSDCSTHGLPRQRFPRPGCTLVHSTRILGVFRENHLPRALLAARVELDQNMTVDETTIAADPMVQVSAWFESALAAGETMPEAMAVATSTPDGRPSCRMVLMRGLDERGLVFYTDRGSDKGQELAANPYAAALLHWFLPVHRQVRLSGAVEEVDDKQSDAYWESRPVGSRRSAVVSQQSHVVASRSVLEDRLDQLAETLPEGTAPPRPPRWGGYRIHPDVVELWEEGRDRLHDRLRYVCENGAWRIERLSP